MLSRIAAYMDGYGMTDGCEALLCGVSGGADSVCLLHAMLALGLPVKAAHFNHMLRGEESDRDESFVRELCAGLGVECIFGRGDVKALAEKERCGTEQAARILRYAFFEECASLLRGCRVATAHNADDNAETMIMNLARGTGLTGLSGIPPVRGIYIRPLLCVTRREIERYLADNGLEHIEDSTNADDAFTRNRLRHTVVPVLKEINPRFSETAAETAALLREDEAYLEAEAEKHIRGELARIKGLAAPIASRALRILADRQGVKLSKTHVDALLALSSGGESVLPGGLVGVRSFDTVYIGPPRGRETPDQTQLVWNAWTRQTVNGTDVFWGEKSECGKINELLSIFSFKKDELCGNIAVRPRRAGDTITLPGRGVTKSLKKLFIEMKIPVREREHIPVVADDKGVLAVYGVGKNVRRSPDAVKDAGSGDSCVVIFAKR
ncbi:MAG: tRNA lysidine(34) synthetase TilS [Oscillospiraceae bacterium]|nr:tRNA lysidine(34) synthetase TilS [Oscillospiraceae bacterium]